MSRHRTEEQHQTISNVFVFTGSIIRHGETLYSTRQTPPAAARPPKLSEEDLGQRTVGCEGRSLWQNSHKEPVSDSMPGVGTKRAEDCASKILWSDEGKSNSSVVIQSAASGGKQAQLINV